MPADLIPPEDLRRSVLSSPLPMILTGAAEDQLILEANDAFCDLTGYSRREILGKNCRFLTGAGTERVARAELRQAVSEARPTVVELTNYKKDGTPFRNAVMIAPFRGDGDCPVFFVGSQMDTNGSGEGSGLRRARARRLIQKLTPRMRQVLELMSAGYRNKQIGAFLKINEKTVKMHRERLVAALDVRSSVEAVRIAVEADLLVSDPDR